MRGTVVTGIQPWIPTLSDWTRPSVSDTQEKEGKRRAYRTYAVYARRLDSNQGFASGEGGFWDFLELEHGFDGALLCKSESVHGGSEHRGVEERFDAMVLYRSLSGFSQRNLAS